MPIDNLVIVYIPTQNFFKYESLRASQEFPSLKNSWDFEIL